jgi:hypothetical protein
MKTIDNYINERLNPRHLGSTDKFPIDGTVEEVCKFLKTNGFKEIKFISPELIMPSFECNPGKRVFMKNKSWVRFADMSGDEISIENPIFYYSYRDEEIVCCVEVSGGYRKLLTKEFLDPKEFLDRVNEHFNW